MHANFSIKAPLLVPNLHASITFSTPSPPLLLLPSFSGELTGGARPLDRAEMTTSRRLADRKTAKFQKNITKRGSVPETTVKKGNDYPVGPLVLGFFIFVVIGSCMPSNLIFILC
uniref:Stress-associated endoplasmic reticulum protein n=1 Tax=Oryza glumipatula TaxID=40148 RepID=A0A0E0BLH8_9ORYZ